MNINLNMTMTIKKKFKVLAWVAGGVLFAVTFISFLTNIFLVSANNDIYEESTRGIEQLSGVQNLLDDARSKEVLAVSYAAVANMDKVAQLEQEMMRRKGVLFEKLGDLHISKTMKDEITSLMNNYFDTAAKTFEHAKHYVTDEASKNITENSRVPFDNLAAQFSTLMDNRVKTAAEQNKKAVRYALISKILLIAAILGAVGLIVLLLKISRSIVEPINAMSGFVKKISRGELNETIKIDSQDEIGEMGNALVEMNAYLIDMAKTAEKIAQGDLRTEVTPKSDKDVLGNAFQTMVAGLRSLITEIRAGAERLASASTQIAASADQTSKSSEISASAVEEMTATMHQMSANMQNVATNTQKQASTVTATSASIEQMVTSIQLVAENVKSLVSISERSKDAVSGGAAAVEQASQGMNGINSAIQRSADTIMSLGSKTDDMSKIV